MITKRLFIFLIISTIGYSQQVLKKTTPTQVFQLALANGYSLPTTCGINNISVGDSGEGGTVSVRSSNNISTGGMNQSTYNPVIIPSEIIGNTTFSNWVGSQQNTWTTQSNPYVSLSFIRKRGRADCNSDNGIDAIIQIWDLPFAQTDGSNIPNGTKIAFSSPTLKDLATGGTLVSNKPIWFEWYNNTWNAIYTNPVTGSPVLQLEDWGTFLNLNNFINVSNTILYPNPSNNFITIQNQEIAIESFGYKILDLTGRIVKNGNSNFGEQINIESLTSGNYIIQIETENDEKFTEKLIKN